MFKGVAVLCLIFLGGCAEPSAFERFYRPADAVERPAAERCTLYLANDENLAVIKKRGLQPIGESEFWAPAQGADPLRDFARSIGANVAVVSESLRETRRGVATRTVQGPGRLVTSTTSESYHVSDRWGRPIGNIDGGSTTQTWEPGAVSYVSEPYAYNVFNYHVWYYQDPLVPGLSAQPEKRP